MVYDESSQRYKFNAETRKCQPHVSGCKPLTSFFKPNGASAVAVESSQKSTARPKTPTGGTTASKKGLASFFKPNTEGKLPVTTHGNKRKMTSGTAKLGPPKKKGTLASMWGGK